MATVAPGRVTALRLKVKASVQPQVMITSSGETT